MRREGGKEGEKGEREGGGMKEKISSVRGG